MAGPLIWTERASADIEAIVRYAARRNPEAAASIGLGIFERAQLLLSHRGVVGNTKSAGRATRRW